MRNALAGIERTLFWTLVFAAFAAVCAGLAARGVDRVADAFEAERGAYAIVRVVAPEALRACRQQKRRSTPRLTWPTLRP